MQPSLISQFSLLCLEAISLFMYRSSKFKCSVNVQMIWGPKISLLYGKQKFKKVFSKRHAIIQFKILHSFLKCLLQKWSAHLKPFKGKYLF